MRDLTERAVDSASAFTGRVVRVRVDTVVLPDGKTGTREVVEHNGAVVVIPIKDGNVYMVRQYRHATGETLLELPAGTLEPGEEPAHAAIRETEEETGFTPGRLTRLFEGYVSPGYSSELQTFWLAEDLSPANADADDDEFLDVVAMPLADALDWVRRGECRDLKTTAGLLGVAERPGLL